MFQDFLDIQYVGDVTSDTEYEKEKEPGTL